MLTKYNCVVILIISSISCAAFKEIDDSYGWRCKDGSNFAISFPDLYIRMDDARMNHVIYRESSGGLEYFEMHLAMKGEGSTIILLSTHPTDQSYNATDIIIAIRPNVTEIYGSGEDEIISEKPNFISTTKYTAIYVNIYNGTLEVGNDCSSSPLITYSDGCLRLMKYFSLDELILAGQVGEKAVFFDCPYEASSCPEETLQPNQAHRNLRNSGFIILMFAIFYCISVFLADMELNGN